MVFVSLGYKSGHARNESHKRVFLLPENDIEDFCMRKESELGTSSEDRNILRKNRETNEIDGYKATSIRTMHYINGKLDSFEKIKDTISGIMRHKEEGQLVADYEFIYDKITENIIGEITIM